MQGIEMLDSVWSCFNSGLCSVKGISLVCVGNILRLNCLVILQLNGDVLSFGIDRLLLVIISFCVVIVLLFNVSMKFDLLCLMFSILLCRCIVMLFLLYLVISILIMCWVELL